MDDNKILQHSEDIAAMKEELKHIDSRLTSFDLRISNLTDMKISISKLCILQEQQQESMKEIKQITAEQQKSIDNISNSIQAFANFNVKLDKINNKTSILEDEVKEIQNGLRSKDKKSENSWKFWTAIGVAFLGVLGSLITTLVVVLK